MNTLTPGRELPVENNSMDTGLLNRPTLKQGTAPDETDLKLGFVSSEQFDNWVRPEEMTHPLRHDK